MLPLRNLTEREANIAAAIGSGRSYNEVARMFGIQRITVRKAVQGIANKLPRECRHPAGPAATIRNWVRSLDGAQLGTKA